MNISLNTTNLGATSQALNAMLESAWIAPFSSAEIRDSFYVSPTNPSLRMSDAVLSSGLSLSYFENDGALSRRYPKGDQGETYIFRSDSLVSSSPSYPKGVIAFPRPTRISRREKFIRDDEIYAIIIHPNDLAPREITYRPLGTLHNSSILVRLGVTFYGAHLLVQNKFGGCGAACENMFRRDNSIAPDWEFQKGCHISNIEEIGTRLRRAGLENIYLRHIFSHDEFGKKSLTNAVKRFGPMMIGIHGEAGGHFIILDHFDAENDIAVIRDPFHGWCIATTAEAIISRHVDQFLAVRR